MYLIEIDDKYFIFTFIYDLNNEFIEQYFHTIVPFLFIDRIYC